MRGLEFLSKYPLMTYPFDAGPVNISCIITSMLYVSTCRRRFWSSAGVFARNPFLPKILEKIGATEGRR